MRRPSPLPRLAAAATLALALALAAAHATPEDRPDAGHPFVAQVRDAASELVVSSLNFLGVPYRRGGSAADAGFDCSGFTRHIFGLNLGLALPRRVDEQAGAAGLSAVAREELKPGDLVFFNTLRRTFSHVGIYVGEGKFIHAPRSGSAVRIEDMRKTYWQRRFTGARRVDSVVAVDAVHAADTPGGPDAAAPPPR